MAFELNGKKFKLNIGGSNKDMIGGVRIESADLPEGVMGEAHKEGVIYISKDIEPDSEQYNRVLQHEMKHMTDLKLGRVDYTEDHVFWNGEYYPRENGYIYFEGEWQEEGDIDFPWEFKD